MVQVRAQLNVERRRRSRGFSLTEVIIALFVFSLLTIIFAGSLMVSNAATGINGQYAQALSLCQHKIDQLRAVGYGRLTFSELEDAEIIDSSPTTSPYRFTVRDGVADILPNGTTSVTIANSASDSRVKIVTVTVTWRSASHRVTNSTARLVGYIANTE